MQWWWLIAGVVLIALVGVVLYSFFVVRPRSMRQLRSSAELLARETHGRAPLVFVPAKCDHAGAGFQPGVGALALTEQGVVFAASLPDRTLIIPRADVTACEASGARLTVAWRSARGDLREARFTTANPQEFAQALGAVRP